jgi:NTE family protein
MGVLNNTSDLFGQNEKFDTGVILSGGGARGFAHAGILKALNEYDIYPDVIAGVSAGAIVGALYADGHSPDQIFDIFSQEDTFFKYVKLKVPGNGLFKTVGLKENLSKSLKAKTFEELQIPLFVVATNINTAEVTYFNTGEILDRVLASAAIPVLFEPIEIEGNLYVDGGVLDNFPVFPLEERCKRLIGISLNPINTQDDFDSLLKIAERTFHLSTSSNISNKIERCEMVFEPEELKEYGLLDTSKGKEMFELGYHSALELLNSLQGR